MFVFKYLIPLRVHFISIARKNQKQRAIKELASFIQICLDEKRVAVIITGASGVEIIQEIGSIVKHMTVEQRTPNLTLSMPQCSLPNSMLPNKQEILELLSKSRESFGGIPCKNQSKNTFEESEEEREFIYYYLKQVI